MKPARGRPRAFDEAHILEQAQRLFLAHGYEGMAYEDMALALGLSKPSLYNAFGDKAALFERALRDYAAHARSAIVASVTGAGSLKEALRRMLLAAADVYAPPSGPSRGCLLVGTALPASLTEAPVQTVLTDFIAGLERDLEGLLDDRYAPDLRRLGKSARAMAMLFASLLFSLSVRARTGISRRRLRAIAAELAGAVG